MNGNITREGITADLEAMARVGIQGVMIFEVAQPEQMAPAGPVAFGSPAWREMFRHAVAEAGRLGMEINMNNDAGWCGSGGPWNTPERSMQKLVWTSTEVKGPCRFNDVLPVPKGTKGFFWDIKVLAWPKVEITAPAAPASPKRRGKRRQEPTEAPAPVAENFVPLDRVMDLSARMNAEGRLEWEVPPGQWLVQRIGHTPMGRKNHPAPEGGLGPECDKFSAEAMQGHFAGLIGQLADDAGAATGKTFSMTHIDSWEVGEQNWTKRMAEEFRARRGYDLFPWLATLAGGPSLGNAELTRRFQRDFKRTQSELVCDAYASALRTLAHGRGLRLSIEAYGPTCDFLNPLDYGAAADVPMAEFWVARWGAWHLLSPRLMASVGHATGKPVIGAESFTAIRQNGSWSEHPYSLKALGDWAFCEGINRLVFHRTVLQPWAGHEPGMTFGPFGTHFDRNQTWWEPGAAFMQYLARCQSLLQQGQFVAEVGRLVPDGENYGSRSSMANLAGRHAPLPDGYNYDYLSDQWLADKTRVVNGRITLAGGMSYQVLQLPEANTMTPQLLRKLRDLVRAGARVAGPRPQASPGLQDYPQCDAEVKKLAAELWGDCDGKTVTENACGQGKVFWGRPMDQVLRQAGALPDFQFAVTPTTTEDALKSVTLGRGNNMGRETYAPMPTKGLNWIHRRTPEADIYFVANPQHRPVEARCSFRIQGRQPELWDPETGSIKTPAAFIAQENSTLVPIHFSPAGSMFVVFRAPARGATQVTWLKRDGVLLFGQDSVATEPLPELWGTPGGVQLETAVAGRYELGYGDGRVRPVTVSPPGPAVSVNGPWQVRFQAGRGAPDSVEFRELHDWTKHPQEGIRYFSGTAVYSTVLHWQSAGGAAQAGQQYQLDLGRVEVMAEVMLNGHALGVLWKPPFTVPVGHALKPGRNELVVKVTNLWSNRLIGDERYPDDCTPGGIWKSGPIPAWPAWFLKGEQRPEPRRLTFTTWKYYTQDTPLASSGLIGPVTVQASATMAIK